MSENVLYSDLRFEAFEILSKGDIPQTLIFAGGSAYCKDFYDTLYQKLIPNIDRLLLKEDATPYDRKIMRNSKNRIEQLLHALKDEKNHNIDLKIWNENNLSFSSFKLSN